MTGYVTAFEVTIHGGIEMCTLYITTTGTTTTIIIIIIIIIRVITQDIGQR